MAKELPYFKFYTSEWLDGDITIESLETQGLFINICALYWSKEGDIFLDKIKKRFRLASDNCFDSLISEELIKVDNDGKITISFLDEQLEKRENLSKINSLNGKKGGKPKKRNESEIKATENRNKATALNSLSETKANESNIEERREDKRKYIKEKSENLKKVEEVKNYFEQTNFDNTMRVFETNRECLRDSLNDFLEVEYLQDNFVNKTDPEILKHFRNWLKFNQPKKNAVKDTSKPNWILETR